MGGGGGGLISAFLNELQYLPACIEWSSTKTSRSRRCVKTQQYSDVNTVPDLTACLSSQVQESGESVAVAERIIHHSESNPLYPRNLINVYRPSSKFAELSTVTFNIPHRQSALGYSSSQQRGGKREKTAVSRITPSPTSQRGYVAPFQ
jgi:hypothetical protein